MRHPRRFLSGLRPLFGLGLALLALAAHATEPGSGELRLRDAAGHVHSLASLDTEVAYRVNGLVAEVELHQRFRNSGNDWLEGEYLLPLPPGAAVFGMELAIGERRIEGRIQTKKAALQTFAQARTSGQRAALVEAGSGNLFRTAVTNVAPGETVDMVLHYWQRVDYRAGEFSLRFPLTYTPRYHMQQQARPGDAGIPVAQAFVGDTTQAPLRTRISVRLDAGVPLAGVSSPSHAIVTSRQGRVWTAQLREERVLPDHDFVLRWHARPFTQPNVASFAQDADGEHYAMLMLLPPQQEIRRLPRELILVIDTSGSMGGESIRQAREALDLALRQLDPQDRFNVIEFNSVTHAWQPGAVPATADAVRAARDWVAGLRARGGTEMAPALHAALAGHAPEGYVRQVVFATDGAVDNPDGLMRMIEGELGDSRLFPIGIGSAPNAGFLAAAARHGRGSETLIVEQNTLDASMRELFAKLDHPAMRDLAIDWPAGTEAYPRQLPDLYLGEPLLVVARLPQAGARIQVHGALADRAWQAPVRLSGGNDAQGLHRLWAQERIADLEDQLARGGDEATLRPAITRTALAAHLVSRYTSLVAVDLTPARSAQDALKHARIPNVMPAGTHFAQTATPAGLEALLALALLMLAALAWWRQRQRG